MENIKTISTRNLCESAKNGGCGECQTSCQSACKTSCGMTEDSQMLPRLRPMPMLIRSSGSLEEKSESS